LIICAFETYQYYLVT